ncbi:hypothetical protein K2X33_03855 [bacterium]|nr:hypothetical protein [bacterium]
MLYRRYALAFFLTASLAHAGCIDEILESGFDGIRWVEALRRRQSDPGAGVDFSGAKAAFDEITAGSAVWPEEVNPGDYLLVSPLGFGEWTLVQVHAIDSSPWQPDRLTLLSWGLGETHEGSVKVLVNPDGDVVVRGGNFPAGARTEVLWAAPNGLDYPMLGAQRPETAWTLTPEQAAALGAFREPTSLETVRNFEIGLPYDPYYLQLQVERQSGAYVFHESTRAPNGDLSMRRWKYNARNGELFIQFSSGQHSEALLQREAALFEKHLGEKIDFNKPIGFGSVESLLEQITAGAPKDPSQLKFPGYLLLREPPTLAGASGYKVLNVAGHMYAEGERTHFFKLAEDDEGFAFDYLPGPTGSSRFRYQTLSQMRYHQPGGPYQAALSSYLRRAEEPLGRQKAWKVDPKYLPAFTRHLDLAEPLEESKHSFGATLVYNALMHMHYETWGLQNIGYTAYGDPTKERNLRSRFRGVTEENYHRALQHLVDRVGAQRFYEGVQMAVDTDFLSLHSNKLHFNSPFTTHADAGGYGADMAQMARDAILNVYPTPMGMNQSGHLVNIAPAYGQSALWTFLRDKQRPLFDRLVEHVLALPEEYEVQAASGWPGIVSRIALLRDEFPEAYAVIHGVRPDFVPKSTRPAITPLIMPRIPKHLKKK